MKNLALSLGLLMAFAGTLSAQVSVEVLLDQDQFLPNESLPVKVRIINNSGQTLRFGDEAWLNYSVEAADGLVVLKNGNPPLAHGFDVRPAEFATTHGDLGPAFDLSKPGTYSVTATVKIKDWNIEVHSQPAHFNIIRGVKLWEQSFGLPQAADDHSQPEIRKYVLQRATFERRTELFLRLTDSAEARTMRLIPIGPLISFSDPQTLLDQRSNLHLIYQESAHTYNYSVVSTDGELTTRQTYFYAGSAPRLRMDESGNIKIIGGVRHLAENDVPSNSKPSLTNELPPPIH